MRVQKKETVAEGRQVGDPAGQELQNPQIFREPPPVSKPAQHEYRFLLGMRVLPFCVFRRGKRYGGNRVLVSCC